MTIPRVMRQLSTRTAPLLLVLLVALASTVLPQETQSPAALITPVAPAAAAMQKSLAIQQDALESFRENAQAASLRQQHESVVRQTAPLQPPLQSPLLQSRTESASPKVPASAASSQEVHNSQSEAFFALPWPGSLPLSMPNVQVADNSCDALGRDEVNKLVQAAAKKHGLDSDLLRSVMKQESAFRPCALSVAGAMGLMQIMPETAETLGLKDPFDPAENVDGGARFLKMMLDRFGGDLPMALGAYNAGPEAVTRAGGVPPIAETLQYVSNILGDLPIAY